jgi:hypothetical protein
MRWTMRTITRRHFLAAPAVIKAAAAAIASSMLLLSCSTALLNENTIDVSTTVDDLITRQIIFNLVRTKQNQFALPSQVQIPQGSVSAGMSASPSLSGPISPSIANTTSGGGSSHGLTWDGVSASLGASIQTTDSWSVTLLQDPEQLRRLRLLYQYGAQQISWRELTCQYPVPELPATAGTPNRRYVRILGQGEKEFVGCSLPNVVLVGDNPNPAFLNFPDCIICAFPNKNFDAVFKKFLKSHKVKIFKGAFAGQFGIPEMEDFSDSFEYVPAVLNNRLAPNSVLLSPTASVQQWEQGIDWLSVVKDGTDAVPDNAGRLGGWGGYTVYVHPRAVQSNNAFTGDEHFSEFVLAVMEALLQPAELQQTGASPNSVVQTLPSH